MPQLPSGRHVGLNPGPLNKMVADIVNNKAVVTWPILEIETPADCLKHMEVIYLIPEGEGEEVQLAEESNPGAEGMKIQRTGLSIADVMSEESDWPLIDKVAFEAFLTDPAIEPFLNDHFSRILELKEALKEHGSFVQKWEALTWENGVHPLQDENDD